MKLDAVQQQRFDSWTTEVRHSRLIRSGIISLLLHSHSQDKAAGAHYRSRYAVQVYNLRAIHIERVERQMGVKGIHPMLAPELNLPEQGGGLYRQLEKAAIRSLYSLGLDQGEVILASCGERKYGVEQITPVHRLHKQQLKRLYVQAEQQLQKEQAGLELEGSMLLLGMDPEFILVDPNAGNVVPASLFLERDGEVGCDAVSAGGITTYPVAELRPSPSATPRGLLIELMHAMKLAGRLIGDHTLIWQAGGMPKPGLPLGGHLHFSGILLTPPLLRALDNYLTLPVSLLEAQSSRDRRPRYGYLGDFRRQPHGGFEYRTLPSFLVSPALTKGIVYLSYLIVLNHAQLLQRPLDNEPIHEAYYSGKRKAIRECIKPLLEELRSLPEYEQYSSSIEPLLKDMLNGKVWNESRDIRSLWKIPN
ncbi:putative amidoligase domain-containing protein [Paenibacillus pini]